MKAEIGEHESVSTAVIRAVGAVKRRKPRSLKPLAEVIDPDALDALFDPRSNDVRQTGGRLSFGYSSCRITIDNGEFLTVEPFAAKTMPESRICMVCQQPIEREDLQRERGESIHHDSQAELRCGISLGTWSEPVV